MWERLARLKAIDAKGCCLVGHPQDKGQFGFVNPAALTLPGAPPEVFFALSFDGVMPEGEVAFHPAFGVES